MIGGCEYTIPGMKLHFSEVAFVYLSISQNIFHICVNLQSEIMYREKILVKFINIFLRLPCFGKKEKSYFLFKTWGHKLPMTFRWPFGSFSYFMSSKIQIVQFCMQIMTSKSYAFQHPILTKIEEQHRTFCASSHTLLRQK